MIGNGYKQNIIMRKEFHPILARYMKIQPEIVVITPDLGYKMFDNIEREFPDRFLKFRAAEQVAMGAAVGMALDGKIPVIYSISPFAIWRPSEIIRNYINHEKVPVKIVGGGRDWDYGKGDISHYEGDICGLIHESFPNILQIYPETDTLESDIYDWLYFDGPSYLNLKR